MNNNLIGWILVGCGLVDVATALLVVAPRVPPERRRTVVAAVTASGALMVSLGGCFLGGVF